jgi:prepilin-type N-terminal cleavage/methylation domain-containing protein
MKKGFTLVELLIVMAVIAILIGIAIPSFRGMQQEAWRTQAQGDVRVLKIAVESYYKNQGAYPATGDTWQDTLIAATPAIIEKALTDPFSSTSASYVYKTDSDTSARYYVIYSVGPSGTDSLSIASTGTLTGTGEIYATNGHK